MDTTETKKSYPVAKFVDSLNKTYLKLMTDVKSSQSQTAYLLERIEKLNEVKKRDQLKQQVNRINQITNINKYDFEILFNELLKSGSISLSFFLDDQEFDQQDQ